jgi:hypothetical protein
MDVRSKVYTYHTEVKWTEQREPALFMKISAAIADSLL